MRSMNPNAQLRIVEPRDSGLIAARCPGMTKGRECAPVALPSVRGQCRLAGLAQPCAILLQAGEHDHVAVIEMSAAKARGITRAGILALLCRSACGGDQNKRNG